VKDVNVIRSICLSAYTDITIVYRLISHLPIKENACSIRPVVSVSALTWFIRYIYYYCNLKFLINDRIGGVMVSVLASSAVDREFEPRSGQTNDYEIGICCFSAKHAALRKKSKYWSALNQNNVSEWRDMSTRWLLFQWASTIKIQLKSVGPEQIGSHHHPIEN
jgi:hypothetical protein